MFLARSPLSPAALLGRTALALALAAPAVALAAPADRAGADRLRTTLEDHLGRPAAGEAPVVTVTPVGDDYELALDFDRLAAPLKIPGLELKLGRSVSRLTEKPDGTWLWRADALQPLSWSHAGQKGSIAFEGFTAEGDFSPALASFTRKTMKVARIVTEQSVPAEGDTPRIDIRRTDEAIDFSATAAPAASGQGVDAAYTQKTGALVETFAISETQAAGLPEMEATLKVAGSTSSGTVTGVRTAAVFGMWRHLVAHHAPEDFTAGQAPFKERIRALGPLFEKFRHTTALERVEFETPVGFGSAGRIEVTVDTTGATREGAADFAMSIAELKIHSLFVPGWAGRLIPSDLTLRGSATGWDAAAPLAAFLDTADFSKAPPLSDEDSARIAALALPKGAVDVVFEGNRMASPTWDISVDGRLSVTATGARGTVTVRATGLDRAGQALRDPKAGDAGRKAADEIAKAITFAETKDGALVWAFVFEGAAVSVNGRSLTPGANP